MHLASPWWSKTAGCFWKHCSYEGRGTRGSGKCLASYKWRRPHKQQLKKLIDEYLEQTFERFPEQASQLGLEKFQRSMKGFVSPMAQFYGVETRTSCPIRVTRDKETYQSVSHAGLYPAGEGAGYAGGITSAAVDGVRVAEAIAAELWWSQEVSKRLVLK